MTVLIQGIEQLEWLVSDGGTRSRDAITVTVAGAVALKSGQILGQITASKKFVAHNAAAADGSEIAAGILLYDTTSVNGDQDAVAYTRDCEVWGARLNSGTAPTAAAIASLVAAGIIVR